MMTKVWGRNGQSVSVLFLYLVFVFLPGTILKGNVTLLEQRERIDPQNRILRDRLDHLLPVLMKQCAIDCWLIICREYNEDPAFFSLMPAQTFSARRLTMLVLMQNEKGIVERFSISPYDIGEIYRGVWQKGLEEQWPALVRLIKEKNPKRIGVNRSRYYAHADGLGAFLEKELLTYLPEEYRKRLVDADELCVRWMETRLPSEEIHFKTVVGFTRDLIARAFSGHRIIPGKTSVEDLQWWMKNEMDRVGVRPWFFPHIDRKGRNEEGLANAGIIKRGDLLHCDVGVIYMGLCSDVQELAYVCQPGETEAPQGLRDGLAAANDFQDLVMAQLVVGRSGNQILTASLKAARKAGIEGACLYSHPLGLYGHAAGPTIGMWDNQQELTGHGDWLVFPDTAFALELNVTRKVSGWAGQVRFGLEEDIMVTEKECRYISGRQTVFHVIR